jgi:ATP-dependent DNA helicase 2 subunit 2
LNFVRNVGDLGEHDIPTKVGGDIFDALDKAVAQIDEYVSTKKYSKKVSLIFPLK